MSGEYEHLTRDARDGVVFLTLNRPERLNALNRRLSAELHAAVMAADADPAARCIVVTGAGERAFSVGADIHEKRAAGDNVAVDDERARGRLEIATCRTPTIAMVNGLAYGGAAVLASSLDLRVGCQHASFRFLAAAHAYINGTWTLPDLVGLAMAKELLFTARVVDAEEAVRIGLLNRLVDCDRLRASTEAMADQIAANDPASVQGIKTLLHDGAATQDRWRNEREYVTNELEPTPAEQAFAGFLAEKNEPDG